MSKTERRKISLSNPFRKSSVSSSATASSSGSAGPQLKPFSPQPSTIAASSPSSSSVTSGDSTEKMTSRSSKLTNGGLSSPSKSSVKSISRSAKEASSTLATPSTSAQPSSNSSPRKPPTRPRQGSLSERGAAVLRALARAPEDPTPDLSPAGSLTPINGEADISTDTSASALPSSSTPASNGVASPKSPLSEDGYNPEGIASAGKRPTPFTFTTLDAAEEDGGTKGDVSRAGSFVGLSEAEKAIGRKNREGLRRRGEQKEVEKMIGAGPRAKRNAEAKKKSKSWEIPRKVFHSSIGFIVLYMYLNDFNLTSVVRAMSTFLAIVITADVIRLNYPPFETVYEAVLGFLMRESEKEKVNGVVWYLIGVIFSLHFYPADIASVSVMMLSWADTSASTFGRLFGRYTPPLPSPPFASRKSLAGFLAAVIAGSFTALLFWGTDIAQSHERFDGVSWKPSHAIFGATSAGVQHSGWNGFAWGFRGYLSPTLAEGGYMGRLSAVLDQASKATGNILSNQVTTSVPGMPLWALCIGSGLVAAISEGLELGGVDDNLSLPILSGFGMWALLFVWGRAASWWVGAA